MPNPLLPPLRAFSLTLTLSLLALSGAGVLAEEARPPFYFGADYPTKPSAEVQQLFDESGLNCIRMTGGGYAWAAKDHKALADDFQKKGHFVYYQLGSHYPSADYFPLKEAWLVDHAGETGVEDRKAWAIAYSGSYWPQYSYTTTRFREMLERDFAAYMAPFQENTNAAGVILHNEPGYHWIKDRLFDYSATSIEKFRAWLAARHGNITTLNERWGTAHESFEGITPPGIPPLPREQVAAWLDWRRFHVDAIADFLKWEAEYFKTLRPDLPRSTNLDGPVNNWYPYRLADIEAYSRAMDVVGIDIYPNEWTKRSFVPYAMDMAQGTAQGRPVHVLECEVFSDKKWKHPEEDRARLLSSQLWTMIGHGADAILMWGFSRGDDFSLTNGEFNPRVRTVRDIAYTGKMLGGFERFQRLPSRVALVVDTDSYLLAAATSQGQGEALSATAHLDMEFQGYYAALRNEGEQVDVILLEQLRREGALAGYQWVFMPDTRLMDEALAQTLTKFVEGGGTLVATGDFAGADRWARPVDKAPGFGLDAVFGGTISKEGAGWKFTKVAGSGAEQSSSVTENQHGKGEAIYISERRGAGYLHRREHEVSDDGRITSSQPLHPYYKLRSPLIYDASNAYLSTSRPDLSALRDPATGNMLLTVTQSDLPEVMDFARVDCQFRYNGRHARFPAAFSIPATQVVDGMTQSGAVPLDIGPTPSGFERLTLKNLDTAAAVLLVSESGAGPLLQVRAPVEITRSAGASVQVTVYNASSVTLKGALEYAIGNAQKSVVVGTIDMEPHGNAVYQVNIKGEEFAPLEGRIPLKFGFKLAGAERAVPGIPVDVVVK